MSMAKLTQYILYFCSVLIYSIIIITPCYPLYVVINNHGEGILSAVFKALSISRPDNKSFQLASLFLAVAITMIFGISFLNFMKYLGKKLHIEIRNPYEQ